MTQSSNAFDHDERYLEVAAQLVIAMPAGKEFISADVLDVMRANGWPELSEPRRLGPMLLRLRHRGYVDKVGERSTRARSHGGVTSEWRRTTREA
ncbi:hypothetical protein OHB12_33365 [Nocardia sp. NBC_01730]|uniref:hypothetical protein n=1 Tax=Nocardia sp. NBC_01730 TaxID=2975998 RepID=UPI002E15BC5E|nr:hypothetical protein OHB12_33365 [Nocardia sp. NBC_01730]